MLVASLLATACALALPTTGRADLNVSLDTSGLTAGYTYALDFQFALGGASTSNTASVYGLGYGTGGGTVDLSNAQTTGAVSVNLQNQSFILAGTTGGYAELLQTFSPGNTLQFSVGVGNQLQTGGSDTFTFGLLYSSTGASGFANIATNNPNLNDSFLEVDTTTTQGGALTVITSTSTGYDPTFSVSAPTVRAIGVPEPSGVWQILLGLPVILLLAWRLR
jgi:hypothetical protein